MESTNLYTSRKKAALVLLGSLVFVAGGIYMALQPEQFKRHPDMFTLAIGVASALFFGLCAIIASRQLITKKLALAIDNKGLAINSGRMGQAVISWDVITGFSGFKLRHQTFIVINIKDPEYFISQESNAIKKRVMRLNVKMCGSPFTLLPGIYEINHSDLLLLLQKSMAAFK